MKTIDLKLSLEKGWVANCSHELGEATGMQQNGYAGFAVSECSKDFIKHWGLEQGLAAVCCALPATGTNYRLLQTPEGYYGIFFFFGEIPLQEVNGNTVKTVRLKTNFTVFCVAPGTAPEFLYEPAKHPKMIAILFNKKFYTLIDNGKPGIVFSAGKANKLFCIGMEELKIAERIMDISAASVSGKKSLGMLEIKGAVYDLLGSYINRISDLGNPIPRQLNDVEALVLLDKKISAQLHEIPSLVNAAISVKMSRSKFKTLFKEVFHEPYYRYYKRKQIFKARDIMIANPHVSIKDIASMVGINSSTVFAKTFKQWHDILPKELKSSFAHTGKDAML